MRVDLRIRSRELQRAAYVPAEHADLPLGHWWIQGRRAIMPALLRRHFPPGVKLLDVGCGAGLLTAVMTETYSMTAVDADATAVEVARRNGIDAHLVYKGQPLPRGFDGVYAFDVMEHTDDDIAFARSLAAAVGTGGLVAIAVPAYSWLWSEMDVAIGHRRRYTLDSLTAVMRSAGIQPIFSTYSNSLLLPLIALGRLVGLNAGHQVKSPPSLINAILAGVFRFEQYLAPWLRLSAGVTAYAIGRVD